MDERSYVIRTKDREAPLALHPIILILDNLRSAYNVGNIFRLAEVCRIKQVYTCGYTASPPHSKLKKTARGCDALVSSVHVDNSLQAIQSLRKDGFQIVALETVDSASYIWEIKFSFPVAFIFGNEALGISSSTLRSCDILARLPTFGRKNSLNVSNCASVVTYLAIQQFMQN